MQVISAYLVKQIVETDTPEPQTGFRFVPKAQLKEWFDEAGGLGAFYAHLGSFDLDDSQNIGWKMDSQGNVENATMTSAVLTYRNRFVCALYNSTGNISVVYFGDRLVDGGNRCPTWDFYAYSYPSFEADSTSIEYTSEYTQDGRSGGPGVPATHFEAQRAEAFEWSCVANAFKVSSLENAQNIVDALNAYDLYPSEQNKQLVHDAIDNYSLNP